VDVITARRETYPSPAVLPVVEPSSLADDLARRDFTINAMAVALDPPELGRLVDPLGGLGDLETKTIRVLHDRSFVDDPTRIFRAIRYESRLGFRMDERTAALAREAVGGGHVGELSGARVRDELVALLEDENVGDSIMRLGELGVAEAVHARLAADGESARLFARLRALRDELALDVPDWRLGLTALARDLPEDELSDWLAELKLRTADGEKIVAAVSSGPRIVEELSTHERTPADVVALAEPGSPDAPLLALALAEVEPLRDYFERLRAIRLEVTGDDLAELGLGESPRVGEILAELRQRKLNGELGGRDSELAAAKELLDS
jgi:tRNA nucleotidyltransferase (CCA-adding enzyme)